MVGLVGEARPAGAGRVRVEATMAMRSGRLAVLRGHQGAVDVVAWSPDGARLASAARDGTVRVWDTRTGECLDRIHVGGRSATCVQYSPDGSRLACVASNWLRVWDGDGWRNF